MNMKLLLTLPLLLLLLVGCANFNNSAGKILSTTAATADATMRGWAAYVVSGEATTNQEEQVRALYARYQASMSVATNAYVAAAASKDKSAWEAASTALQASAQSLLAAVNAFSSPRKE